MVAHNWGMTELVESAARTGRIDLAADAPDRPADREGTGARNRLGARYRGPLASPAERWRHRRARVPGGCRASQPGTGAREAGPRSPAVRGVAGQRKRADVLLRCELNALPLREDTGALYASTVTVADAQGHEVPVAHSCGHDMRMSCMTGMATLMAAPQADCEGFAPAGVPLLGRSVPRVGARHRDSRWRARRRSG